MSAMAAPTLSAQEEAIESGKQVMHGTVTDRVLRLYEAIHPSQPPRVALERAVLFTESFKETEGQPLVLRWAKAQNALYVEMWREAAQLETHIRSRAYQQLLALMDTAAARPELRFNFVAETRGLGWVEQLRLGGKGATSESE